MKSYLGQRLYTIYTNIFHNNQKPIIKIYIFPLKNNILLFQNVFYIRVVRALGSIGKESKVVKKWLQHQVQKYIVRIILAISFNSTQETNPIKAQNAGFIDFCKSFWCRYSPNKAQANGHRINPAGQANNHIIIHMIHHQFHR